jgi:hypothetical protein
MTNASKRGTEMKELKYEKSFGSKGAEANREQVCLPKIQTQ